MIPRYIAVDPGKTVGYAMFDDKGVAINQGQATYQEFMQILNMLHSSPVANGNLTFIVEDFKLLPDQARKVASNPYSRGMEASKIIGAIELLCALIKAELVMQLPEKWKIAKAWTGLDANVNHAASNWKSAFNHGVFYLVTNNIQTRQHFISNQVKR